MASHATHSHPDAKLKFNPPFVLSAALWVKILCRIRAIVRDSFNGIVTKVSIRVIKFTLVAFQLWACSVAWAEQDASDKRHANKASSSQENYHSAHHQHQKTKRSLLRTMVKRIQARHPVQRGVQPGNRRQTQSPKRALCQLLRMWLRRSPKISASSKTNPHKSSNCFARLWP